MYMFRTSWVHHQEGSLYMQLCMVYFSCRLAGGKVFSDAAYINAWKTYHTKLHLQTAFLKMNPLGSKHVHVEDAKNLINGLMWKVCTASVLHYIIVSHVHYIIVSHLHYITVSHVYYIIVLHLHYIIVSHLQYIILSQCTVQKTQNQVMFVTVVENCFYVAAK